MSKTFKFPPDEPAPPVPQGEAISHAPEPPKVDDAEAGLTTAGVVAPSSVEVPPPPPVDKEPPLSLSTMDSVDEIGETEEISLN